MTETLSAPLTLPEADALAGHEMTIERHLDTFVAVGEALLAIRDGRLYRDTHDTFAAYCDKRWGLTRKRGYDLIAAAQVAAAVSPIGDIPANESVARELAPLRNDPEAAQLAWAETLERTNGHAPTAAQTREVVRQHHPPRRAVPDGPRQRPPREVMNPVGWVASLEMLHADLRDRMRQSATPEVRERYRPGLDRLDRIRADLERFVDPA
jgi:hypothetical protein